MGLDLLLIKLKKYILKIYNFKRVKKKEGIGFPMITQSFANA